MTAKKKTARARRSTPPIGSIVDTLVFAVWDLKDRIERLEAAMPVLLSLNALVAKGLAVPLADAAPTEPVSKGDRPCSS
jgi:hypothetical protein